MAKEHEREHFNEDVRLHVFASLSAFSRISCIQSVLVLSSSRILIPAIGDFFSYSLRNMEFIIGARLQPACVARGG